MKVTIHQDGSVTFDVESAADIALAREFSASNGNGEAFPPPRPAVKPASVEEAVLGKSVPDDDDEDTEEEFGDIVLPAAPVAERRKRQVRTYEATPDRLNAAKEMGVAFGHYQVWEFLVDNDSRSHGVTSMDVMRRFKITRGSANQRLIRLTKLGYAKRVGRGAYKAACR